MAQIYDVNVQQQRDLTAKLAWLFVVLILLQAGLLGWLVLYPYGGGGEVCGYVHSIDTPATYGFPAVLLNTSKRTPEVFEASMRIMQYPTDFVSHFVCFEARPQWPWEDTRYMLEDISLR